MTLSPEPTAAYTAAHEAAAFTDASEHGWLRLTGRDRLDLLHRLSTNDVRALGPGNGRPTVLTSPTGRVMALLTVYADAEAAFVRLQPGQTTGIIRYLGSMIFWQDQVEVADLSRETAQFGIYGPRSGELLGGLTGLDPAAILSYGWVAGRIDGAEITLHRCGSLEAPAWMIVVASLNAPRVRLALAAASPELAAGDAELLRIEAGIPTWGRELSDGVTPLETGLLPAISFNKGCYTGQEVIARQTNYDKVTRNLVGLILDGLSSFPLPLAGGGGQGWGTVPGPGRGGFVGSVAWSPALDRPIALAIVPRELAAPGSTVTVIREGQELTATVVGLPFVTRNE